MNALAWLLLFGTGISAHAATSDWTTEFERTRGERTFTYDETIDYCRRLDRASKWIRYQSFGKSGEGRDLPLLIVDKNGDSSAERAHRRGKAIVLVQAGIHSGEIDGKDAGLMLIREMAITRERENLLDHVTLLFVPIYNVDGHEHVRAYNRVNQNGPANAGFRANATLLNLNRDYMKADAPETRAWLALWNEWDPDFFADCHVTDGADHPYVVSYFAEGFQNADPAVAEWTKQRYLPPLTAGMREDGFDLMLYGDFRSSHDPRSGMKSGPSTPRFSTGYVTLANRPGLLIETHMFKDYPTRVRGTHSILSRTLELLNAECQTLRRINQEADARAARTAADAAVVPLRFELTYGDSVMMDFNAFELDAVKSEVSGGTWHRYGKTPVPLRIPLFTTQTVTASVKLPAQYWIPPQWTSVVERLQLHGVEFTRLDSPVTRAVSSYRLTKPVWVLDSFEGHHTVTFTTERIDETRTFPAGTVVVDTAQRRAKIVAGLLEPEAPDALVAWGFLDAVFEAKEYVESYVMEGIARDMLRDDATLRAEFETAKRDPSFAKDPEKIRQWFYERSRFAETRVGVYPIARIESATTTAR